MPTDLATAMQTNGFAFARAVYKPEELNTIVRSIKSKADTYAIQQVMREVPTLADHVFNPSLKAIIQQFFDGPAFVTKSIWFDKPAGGNWFVGYHQDISICVDHKADVAGYSRWTSRQGLIGVVPPQDVLERTLTVRIHIDDADASNGALKVKTASHLQGIRRDTLENSLEVECIMNAGDVMLMRPLLLHSSMRSTTDQPRRVLHLEITDHELAAPLEWKEKLSF